MASSRKRSMNSNQAASSSPSSIVKTKEYTDLFDYDIDLVLINSSIVAIPFPIDSLVNCTGPNFEHHGIYRLLNL